ncbi:MAG: MotA/TolQ/ExbB proton channel family protein [Bacillota bacterium]|nr:MotA/TolQ/ExbB proton channel family protein [Bacillota bacterium]
MFGIILRNLLGFDLLILLLALVNILWAYPRAHRSIRALSNQLQPRLYEPIEALVSRLSGTQKEKLDLRELQAMKDEQAISYSIFNTITASFPLLGMLGTVLSLLHMVDFAQQRVIVSFTVALTSTFWGLVFALIFRSLDTTLAPAAESNEQGLKMLLERLDSTV